MKCYERCRSAPTFSDEFAMNLGVWLSLKLGQDNHAFPDLLALHFLEGKGRRLSCGYSWNTYPLALDGANGRWDELSK